MSNPLYTHQDLTDEMVQYIDRYIKKSISNTKRKYYRETGKAKKYGISLVDIADYENSSALSEPGLEDCCSYFVVQGERIAISDPDLYDAILRLTSTQRDVILQNVVLQIPLKHIAEELGVTERATQKQKHNAIDALKRMLRHD